MAFSYNTIRLTGGRRAFNQFNRLILNFLLLPFLIFSDAYINAQTGIEIELKSIAMHYCNIVYADSDASGNVMLTIDETGKSILWNSANLNPIRFFNAEAANNTKYSGAISDNGNLIAVAADRVFIFETTTGNLLAQLSDLQNGVTALKFIRDQFLAVATGNSETIILNTGNWKVEHKLSHKLGTPLEMDVDAAGWLAVLFDTGIEMYDNGFNSNTSIRLPTGMVPASIKFSPDGSRLAVGFSSPHLPLIYDASELSDPVYPRFPAGEVNTGAFRFIDYTKDGMYLIAAGEAKISLLRKEIDRKGFSDHNEYFIGRWSRMGIGEFGVITVGKSPVSTLIALPGGCILYTDSSPVLVKLSATGQKAISRMAAHNRFGSVNPDMIRLNANADELIINFENTEPLRLSLKNQSFETQSEINSLPRARVAKQELPSLKLTNWKNSEKVHLNGIPVSWIPEGDIIRCADIADHGLRFVLGSDRAIYCAGRDGGLIWSKPFPEPVRYINISGNTRVLVAALDDGRLVWVRMSDGKTLLQFLSYNSNKYWAFSTGLGFLEYNTADAREIFGLSLKQQSNNVASFLPLAFLDSSYFINGIVAKLSLDWDEERLLARESITAPDFSGYFPSLDSLQPILLSASKVAAPVVSGRFHLIVASYPQPDQALRHAERLVKQGYKEAKNLESAGRYRVSLQSFNNFEEALKRRSQLVNQFSGIWVLKDDTPDK